MDRSFQLRDEDRADYATVLDAVIASAEIQRLLARSRVGAGQLRLKGLAAAPRVVASAEAEYRSYTELRQRLRDGDERAGRTAPLSGPGHQERDGAGLVPVLAVLTPVLAAVAAATFLLLGYVLRLTDSGSALADTLIGAGWISLGIAAFAAVIGVVALYRTAAEHKESPAGGPQGHAESSAELDRAREAWLAVLGDSGIRPFLVARLQDEPAKPGPASTSGTGHGAGAARRSRYSSPDFGSPDFSRPDFAGPHFSSPDFDGPGAGGPSTGRPDFSSPDFSSPDFSSPDFDGPGTGGDGPDSGGPVTADSGTGGPDFSSPDFTGPDFAGPGFGRPDFGRPDFSGPGLPDKRA
ncbi:hypothetical protein [Streptomyces sp. PTD5-9]|uniref:hypothetical protein n=1 Tax=Streptomyces sp. PTD5-9 TaxID=3120150 RepID=UPI00300B5D22